MARKGKGRLNLSIQIELKEWVEQQSEETGYSQVVIISELIRKEMKRKKK
jgi:hypothetical protein